ncbi:hypothetical protein [Salipaludibacillus sp. CF4.18]
MTEGALDCHKKWVSSEYIPYNYLRKSWYVNTKSNNYLKVDQLVFSRC